MKVRGKFHASGRFTPEKEPPILIEEEADWAPERVT
jgi:hypothetical protein